MKKIMFNDSCGLTQAVLIGRKTQTRRIIKEFHYGLIVPPANSTRIKRGVRDCFVVSRYVWLETIAIAQSYASLNLNDPCFDWMETEPGWTNKMFVKADLMPHHIRITDIRVERLQDISDADCIAEGIQVTKRFDDYKDVYVFDCLGYREHLYDTPQEAYAALIDRVSGNGTWDSNPYVFVYDFELVD